MFCLTNFISRLLIVVIHYYYYQVDMCVYGYQQPFLILSQINYFSQTPHIERQTFINVALIDADKIHIRCVLVA